MIKLFKTGRSVAFPGEVKSDDELVLYVNWGVPNAVISMRGGRRAEP